MTKIVIASQNQGKIVEFKQLLDPLELEVRGLDVDEVGLSFAENALLKARACADEAEGFYIGDDSGLMVEDLQGMPGILSKRWGGATCFEEAIANVFSDLDGSQERFKAQLVCCIALLRHQKDPLPKFFIGIHEGILCREPKGGTGFGYDPYFYLESYGKTVGELDLSIKNSISHRAKAAKKLREFVL